MSEHQTFTETSTRHTDICNDKEVTADLSVLEEEIASVDKRWNELCATVGERLRTLENVQEDVHRHQLLLNVVKKTLIELEQIVYVEYILVLDQNKSKQDLAEVKVRDRNSGYSGRIFC